MAKKETRKGDEERYRLAIENSNDGITFVENGIHKYVNETYLKLFGFETPKEILNTPFSKIIRKNQKERLVNNCFSNYTFNNPISKYVCQGIRKDGQILFLEISETVVQSKNQSSSIVIVRDITQQKNLPKLLRHAKKMEAMRTMAIGIAHEFNNTLGIIIGCSQLSLSSLEIQEDTDLYNHLTHILNAGFRAQDLVQQIHTFSRQQEGKKKPLQINIIIKEALKMVRAAIPSTISIRQEIDNEVGKVNADSVQIYQIIMNLCNKATHAMRKKGGTLRVDLNKVSLDDSDPTLSYLNPGYYVLLTISDTGEGIDDAQLQHIFDPCFTSNEMEEQTDFGLCVVYEIVQNLQGAIKVNSKINQGSIFEIYIPQIVDSNSSHVNIENLQKIGTGIGHILLVDDDNTLMSVSKQMLTSLGYSVEGFSCSIEAFNSFCRNPNRFNLVLTDQTMPGLTGLILSQKILNIRPKIPIFLSTGFSDQITENQAKSCGIRELLFKPIDLNLLADKLVMHLRTFSDDYVYNLPA